MPELTLEEAKNLLETCKFAEVHPNCNYILAYDTNALSFRDMRNLAEVLKRMQVKEVAFVGYDGSLTDNPFHLYEVKDADISRNCGQ